MLTLEVRFVSGRFHGTPWGASVLEGEVEWPPSPWRVLRGLLATGFRIQAWREVPAPVEELLGVLGDVLPAYWLPEGTVGHLRAYLPPISGNKTKQPDAFVDVGSDPIQIQWPVELSPDHLRWLDALLEGWRYIGRAESWIEARRVSPEAMVAANTVTSESAPGPGLVRTSLLAPVPRSEYAVWRVEAARLALERRSKGKAPKPADRAAVDASHPPTLLGALLMDPARMHDFGWSQPPGSRWVSYWRPTEATEATPRPRRNGARGAENEQRANAAVFALVSRTESANHRPRVTDTIRLSEHLHDALVSQCRKPVPAQILGVDAEHRRLEGHHHLYLLPATTGDARTSDGEPRIDHLVVHARGGFDERTEEVLRKPLTIYGKHDPAYLLTLVLLGPASEAAGLRLLKTSRQWESFTPFVPPRFLKRGGKNSLAGQIAAELESHNLPAAKIELEWEDEKGARIWRAPEDAEAGLRLAVGRWLKYRRRRFEGHPQPPSASGFGVRLTFENPVAGPIALGYASHFGLGVFIPILEE